MLGCPGTHYDTPGRVEGFVDAVKREVSHFAPSRKRGLSLDEALGEAMEACGPQEVAYALGEFLNGQPDDVKAAAVAMLVELEERFVSGNAFHP
jgi:hypothetical protein